MSPCSPDSPERHLLVALEWCVAADDRIPNVRIEFDSPASGGTSADRTSEEHKSSEQVIASTAVSAMAVLAGLVFVFIVVLAPDRADLSTLTKVGERGSVPTPPVEQIEEPFDPFTLHPVPVLLDGRVVNIEPLDDGLLALMGRPGMAPGTTPRMLRSDDGREWTPVATEVRFGDDENTTEYQWIELQKMGNEFFLAASDGSAYELFRSTTGSDWEHWSTPASWPFDPSAFTDGTDAVAAISETGQTIYRLRSSTSTLSISGTNSASLSSPLDSTTFVLDVPVPAVESTDPFANGVVLYASDDQIFYDTPSGTWLIEPPPLGQ